MNSIEFIVTFTLTITMIGFGYAAIKGIEKKAIESHHSFEAKLEAEKCAALIDSFFSNAGGKFDDPKLECHTQNNEIVSTKNDAEKKSLTVAQVKKIGFGENGEAIEIDVRPHYEK